MNVKMEQIEQLVRIYNTFQEVYTKGESTILMADCMKAFAEVLNQLSQAQQSAAAAPEHVDAEIVEE